MLRPLLFELGLLFNCVLNQNATADRTSSTFERGYVLKTPRPANPYTVPSTFKTPGPAARWNEVETLCHAARARSGAIQCPTRTHSMSHTYCTMHACATWYTRGGRVRGV